MTPARGHRVGDHGDRRAGLRISQRSDIARSSQPAQPHSLNPHTWHFTQPSAYSSCEPQSGHVPMNDSEARASNESCACSPVGVTWATVISSRAGALLRAA